jgi:hypothetical protein
MPLPNTYNTPPSFRELGKIRKGVTVATKNGGTRPKEVEYFVMDFLPEESEAAKIFFDRYGREPKAITIHAPFDDVERWWDAWLRCFKGGRLVANAGVNPKLAIGNGLDVDTIFFERLFDVSQNKWVVKHWITEDGSPRPVDMRCNIDPRNGEYRGEVIYSTVNKEGKETDYYLTATGTLKVMIRELIPFLGFMTLHTNGKVDVSNISGELAGIKLRADQAGIKMHEIPLVLSRRKESVRDPNGNNTYHYNIHVGIDPEFSKRLYLLQESRRESYFANLLPEPVQSNRPVSPGLPEPDLPDDYFDSLPDDIVEAEYDESDSGDGDVIIADYKDLWTYAQSLGLDMKAEKDNINAIWREMADNPAAAVSAINKLAGKE